MAGGWAVGHLAEGGSGNRVWQERTSGLGVGCRVALGDKGSERKQKSCQNGGVPIPFWQDRFFCVYMRMLLCLAGFVGRGKGQLAQLQAGNSGNVAGRGCH